MAGHVAPFCPLYFLVTAGLVFAAILPLQLQVCTMCSLALKCEFIHYYLEKTKKKKCSIQNLIFVGIWVFHSDHITFIKDVAATQPPQHLCHLLRMLKTKGGSFFVPCFFFLLVPRFFRTW